MHNIAKMSAKILVKTMVSKKVRNLVIYTQKMISAIPKAKSEKGALVIKKLILVKSLISVPAKEEVHNTPKANDTGRAIILRVTRKKSTKVPNNFSGLLG